MLRAINAAGAPGTRTAVAGRRIAKLELLVTAEVPGQTEQGYDGMLAVLADGLKQAPGFVLHTAHPIEGGLASH